MFTGIIEGLGRVAGIRPAGEGRRLTIESDFALSDTRIGDSIAVSGVCLTAVTLSGHRFEVDVSPETAMRSTFGNCKIGQRVNLERAVRLGDRLDGHLVSGHIDGLATIAERVIRSNAILISFTAPEAQTRYMIEKGSVAVDGVSLTINACSRQGFEVSIIPLTAELTTVGMKKIGEQVNIETDMVGKYIEKFTLGRSAAKNADAAQRPGIDLDYLNKTGFL
jgi:riboflavin synthase